jgi:Mor family transcriptional regulator
MLARKEKQNLVIDLYKQDKTVREIAKEVHMSFSDISTIIKREFGDEDVTKDAQIFKLFERGRKPIDIAIKFNTSANEVQKLHREYRSL